MLQVSSGEPIQLNYGSHDNANLLSSYGFVVWPDDNKADRVRVNLDIDTLLVSHLGWGSRRDGGGGRNSCSCRCAL